MPKIIDLKQEWVSTFPSHWNMPQLCSGLKICVTAGICPTWAKLQLPRLKSTLVLVRNLPKLQLQRLKSTGKKFAQTSASEAEKYGVKKEICHSILRRERIMLRVSKRKVKAHVWPLLMILLTLSCFQFSFGTLLKPFKKRKIRWTKFWRRKRG